MCRRCYDDADDDDEEQGIDSDRQGPVRSSDSTSVNFEETIEIPKAPKLPKTTEVKKKQISFKKWESIKIDREQSPFSQVFVLSRFLNDIHIHVYT